MKHRDARILQKPWEYSQCIDPSPRLTLPPEYKKISVKNASTAENSHKTFDDKKRGKRHSAVRASLKSTESFASDEPP